MSDLPRIPTPPALRWREFRLRFIPMIVFVAALTTVVSMWRDYVSPATLVGEVETVQVEVKSPRAGSLAHLKVSRLQEVNEGEILGEVATTDPNIIKASLNLAQARIDQVRTGIDMTGVERTKINFADLSLRILAQEVELARARENLKFAEQEVDRDAKLLEQGILPPREYDLSLSKKRALEEQVEGISRLVEDMKGELKKIEPVRAHGASGADPLEAAIEVEEKNLDLITAQMSPVVLKAPMRGTVSMIYRQAGENVLAGEPILTISGQSSDRIIGYLRPPLTFQPRVGMKAIVTTRGFKREEADASLLAVGTQFEPITNALLRTPQASFEVGLPVIFGRPPQMKALPGELLDLKLVPR